VDRLDEIRKLMSDLFNVPESDINAEFEIGSSDRWDSLTHMELITAIEQKYEVEFTMDEVVEMTSVSAICSVLNRK